MNTIPLNPKYRSPSRAAIFACYHADEGITIGRTSRVFYVAFTAPPPACYALPPHPSPQVPFGNASPSLGHRCAAFFALEGDWGVPPFFCAPCISRTAMQNVSSITAGRANTTCRDKGLLRVVPINRLPHPRNSGSYHPHPRLHHRLPARGGLSPIAYAPRGAPRSRLGAPLSPSRAIFLSASLSPASTPSNRRRLVPR